MSGDNLFQSAFLVAQDRLGLGHYHVTFRPVEDAVNYATCDVDPEACIATIRFNPAKMRDDGATESTAAHEVIHLLLADLIHALENRLPSAAIEEERVARRLEPLIHRALFGHS